MACKRGRKRDDWDAVASIFGYLSAREMLEDGYVRQNLSLYDIAAHIGFSKAGVRRRLMEYGFVLRKRGNSGNDERRPETNAG